MSTAFAAGEGQWRAQLGKLRDVVRQEMVTRQLGRHLPASAARVLDIGCGQGTQALRLASRGHQVTGLDTSAELLADFETALAAEPADVRARVRLVQGSAEAVAELFPAAGFDAVLCQGVLMYLPAPEPVIAGIAQVVAPDGIVSLLVRNGDALAMRPALLGDWSAAAQAFDGSAYVNRIGVRARADRLDTLTAVLAAHRLSVRAWYGVRIFTDAAPDQAAAPDAEQLATLLDCEERAGRTDPYRRVAALTHLIAAVSR